jgi:transcriptional regulator with XRE-family HTH domain
LPFCHVRLSARKPTNPAYPKELRTLGDHLRKKRLDLGLLQREVAKRIGVSSATAWQWEKNRTEPETRYVPAIVEFLGYLPPVPCGSFPEALRTARRVAGLSQEQLANLARLDESTIAKWERGDTLPLRSTTERLQRFFETIGQPMPEFGPEVFYSSERRSRAARNGRGVVRGEPRG